MNALRTLVSPRGAVFLLLVILLIAVTILNPSFAEPGQFMRFIQRVAPVAIVAIGQYFVIIAGEFDLSQGSLITAQVIIAGNLVGQDDSRTVPVLVLMVVFGALVGLVNGLITTLLKVPSFIVTLGMMLALLGGVMWWTGGAATGNPSDSFREIGRGGIRDVCPSWSSSHGRCSCSPGGWRSASGSPSAPSVSCSSPPATTREPSITRVPGARG